MVWATSGIASAETIRIVLRALAIPAYHLLNHYVENGPRVQEFC
jgi:hypothetical protein